LDKTDAAVGWVGEKDPRTETDTPEMAKVAIPVHELYANPRATQRLLDDAAIRLKSWLSEKIGKIWLPLRMLPLLQETGIKKPKGFLSYEVTPAAAFEWGKLESVQTGQDGAFRDANPEQDPIDHPDILCKTVDVACRCELGLRPHTSTDTASGDRVEL